MSATGWLTAFATGGLASAAIGAILEYVGHAIHHGHKDNK